MHYNKKRGLQHTLLCVKQLQIRAPKMKSEAVTHTQKKSRISYLIQGSWPQVWVNSQLHSLPHFLFSCHLLLIYNSQITSPWYIWVQRHHIPNQYLRQQNNPASDSYHIILQCFMNTFLLHANLKPSGQETPYCWLYILNQNVFELCKPEGYE